MKFTLPCLGLILAILIMCSGAAADPVAEWAPEDALVFAGIPDWNGAVDAFKKTQQYRSLEDPALNRSVQPWKKLAENARNLIAKEIGLENPQDLEVWPHGGVAFFLQADLTGGDGEEEVRLCLVAEMGEDAERARSVADRIVQHCLQNGGQRSVEEVGGTEITSIRFEPKQEEDAESEEAEPLDVEALLEGVELEEMQLMVISGLLQNLGAPESFAFAFADTRLILGSDMTTVRDTLVRLRRGAEGSLAELRDVRAFGREESDKTHALLAVNLPVLMKGLGSEDEESRKIVSALSADALGPLVLTVQIAPEEGIELRSRGFMRIDSRPHGLGRILMMQNMETAPPPGVSADTALYASLNLNPQLILEEVLAISEQIDPDSAEEIRSSLSVPQEDGSILDIKTDVVGQLSGPLTFGLNLAKPFDAENVNMIVRLGHKSRDAMTRLAGLLPPGMLTPSEMLGHTVYNTPFIAGLAMGFTEQAVIPFATTRALENYLRSEGQSGRGLAQTPGFQGAARHVPAQSCGMVYVDGVRFMDAQMAMAENPPETPEFGEATLSEFIRWGIGQSSADVDVDLLKAARKYSYHFIATMSTQSDGLRFDAVQVTAEADAGSSE